MNKNLVAILLAAAIVLAQPAAAQGNSADVTDLQALRTAVKADKRAFVASTLELTDAEAKKFWPLYDAYQRGLDLANRERNLALEGLIGLDKPPSDLFAKSLARELVSADEMEVRARRTLYNGLMKALPARRLRATCSSNRRSAPSRCTTSRRRSRWSSSQSCAYASPPLRRVSSIPRASSRDDRNHVRSPVPGLERRA